MPTDNFNLKTEYTTLSSVLIVDEVGELPTLLVDALLSHGCLVNYFGEEPEESFHYLLGKNNFVYHSLLEKEKPLGKFNYLFYFPSESFSKFGSLSSLIKDFLVKTLICVSLEFSKKKKLKNIVGELQQDIRIAYFDCLFGPRIKKGFLGNFFTSAVKEGKVVIEGDSMKEISPLPGKELVKELIRLIFSPDTEGKEYFLCPKDKSTPFSFASILKNVLPGVDLVFSERSQEKDLESKGLEKLEISFNLEERIQETIDWFRRNLLKEAKETHLPVEEIPAIPQVVTAEEVSLEEPPRASSLEVQSNPQPPAEEKEKLDFLFPQKENLSLSDTRSGKTFIKKFVFAVFIFLLLIFIFFLVPIGLSVGAGFLGFNKLIGIKGQVDKGNFSSATLEAQQAQKLFALSRKAITISGPFYGLIGLRKQVEIVSEAFPLVENLIDSLQFSLLAAEQAVDLEKSFLNEEEIKWADVLGPLGANLSSAYEQASLAQASLAEIESVFKFFNQTSNFEKIKAVLPKSREILLKSENLVNVLPKILGVGGIKTYLVLFQNNMELRPTGGFIGSYGILRLENGRLINFEVFDVYQADGQLKGHVEPPTKLKEYLGEASWYLRDSNWDPDFPVSAKRAQWFLDKETQVSVDGTIAINLEVVKKLLVALGEVEVSDYQEKINAGNLFQKAEYYSELGTFPGSTQKKDFLASLAKTIFEDLRQTKKEALLNMAGAIFSSLDQKEIMLYFDDPKIEQAIANLNWEGSIRNYQLAGAGDSVFTDYLSINEANIGINKANYYIQRKVDQQVTIDETGKVKEKLTLTYENLSPSENWPAGRYKNYLRIYLKKDSKLSSAFIDDPTNPGLWLPFDSQYLDMSEEHGKTIYGFVFEVPIKSKRKIEINYELTESLLLSPKLTSYLLLVQKQSGAFPSNYDLTIFYPENFVPLRVIPSAVVGNQQLLISTKLNKDLIYQIDLAH